MAKLAIIVIMLTMAKLSSASSECDMEDKAVKKVVKLYWKACLSKGFKSTLGCESNHLEGTLKKKSQRRCNRLEGKLTNMCNYTCPIDGGWGNFSDWSSCSAECGGGSQSRNRACNNPTPQFNGTDCVGDAVESRVCNDNPCPVNGGWTAWGEWSRCSAECGGGRQERKRSCSNPEPKFGGAACAGDSVEFQDCNTRSCAVDGGWSSYGSWSGCSNKCGYGTQLRSRTCTNPAPANGGSPCSGSSTENQSCHDTSACEGGIELKDRHYITSKTLLYNGFWGDWGNWQYCNGGYAVSFDQKVEGEQGGDDDTSLNGICLQCSNGGEICSSTSSWGGWEITERCEAGFSGSDFKVEEQQGGGDDTAANGLELVCSSDGGSYRTSNEGPWGSWLGYQYCATGQKICGIQTRVEAAQGGDDDTALNGVDLMCCGSVTSVKVGLVEVFSRSADGSADLEGANYIKQVSSSVGMIQNSGYYSASTAAEIAGKVQAASDYSAIAGRISPDQSVKNVLSSALDNRQGSSSVTLSVPVNVYQSVYAYVGEATLTLSDGSVLKFRGSEMMKSEVQLNTDGWNLMF